MSAARPEHYPGFAPRLGQTGSERASRIAKDSDCGTLSRDALNSAGALADIILSTFRDGPTVDRRMPRNARTRLAREDVADTPSASER